MSGTAPAPTSSVDVYADEVYSSGTGHDLLADVFWAGEWANPLPVIPSLSPSPHRLIRVRMEAGSSPYR